MLKMIRRLNEKMFAIPRAKQRMIHSTPTLLSSQQLVICRDDVRQVAPGIPPLLFHAFIRHTIDSEGSCSPLAIDTCSSSAMTIRSIALCLTLTEVARPEFFSDRHCAGSSRPVTIESMRSSSRQRWWRERAARSLNLAEQVYTCKLLGSFVVDGRLRVG